jgi:BASS family bile acid:Na+ symporter
MTMCSTLAAVIMTPILTQWLAGAYVRVDAWGIFLTTGQVVIAPILLGLVLHHRAPRLTSCILPAGPLLSVLVISLIVGSIIGQNSKAIFEHGPLLLAAVVLLHGGGFALGYLVTRALGYDRIIARTVSVEVGMQNSGLGAVLARARFTAEPLVAVPSALSSVCHSLMGSLLAGLWRLQEDRKANDESGPPAPPSSPPS